MQRRALEQAGVKFIEANKSGGPGVRLRETPHDRVSYPCGGSFELCVGREEATFCKAACRHAFWSAAQHWVMRAVGAGLLSSDILKAAWAASGIPSRAGDDGLMDRPAFPIRLLFQLIGQRDGEARNPAPRFGGSWAFSWRGVGQSDRIDRSACDDDRGLPLRTGARHPSMHRTETLDYALVLDAEIDRMLTDCEILLKVGDTVVQREPSTLDPIGQIASRASLCSDRRTVRPRSPAAPLCAGRGAHTINGTRLRKIK